MRYWKRMLMAAVMLGIMLAGAFAQEQKRNEQKPPPKDQTPKVVVKEKPNPPPNNSRRGEGQRDNKRGKP